MISEENFITIVKKSLHLSKMHLDDEFRDYDEWNSLNFITLIDLLEDEFSIEVDPDFFSDIDTWRDLYNALKH